MSLSYRCDTHEHNGMILARKWGCFPVPIVFCERAMEYIVLSQDDFGQNAAPDDDTCSHETYDESLPGVPASAVLQQSEDGAVLAMPIGG